MPGPVFIEGENVSLRTVEEEDIEFLHERINDPRIWRPIDRSRPLNGQQERAFFEEVVCDDDTVHLLVVADVSSDSTADATEATPVGTIGLDPVDWEARTAEIGYWIDPDHQGKGYGTEAVDLLVAHAFDQLGLHRITARVFAFNEPSARLLEHVGFVREGTQREAAFVDGERHDTHLYGLLAAEWRTNEANSVA